MTLGLRLYSPARPRSPASLPVRVPTVEGLPPALWVSPLRFPLGRSATVVVITPSGTFHPKRFGTCQAHECARPRAQRLPQHHRAGYFGHRFRFVSSCARGRAHSDPQRIMSPCIIRPSPRQGRHECRSETMIAPIMPPLAGLGWQLRCKRGNNPDEFSIPARATRAGDRLKPGLQTAGSGSWFQGMCATNDGLPWTVHW